MGHLMIIDEVRDLIDGLEIIPGDPDVPFGMGEGELRIGDGYAHAGVAQVQPQPDRPGRAVGLRVGGFVRALA